MNDWFTVEKIDDSTYCISEYKHWEQVHSYLLVGEDKALLIDTGLGVSNIKDVILEITKKEVQVVTTHIHWDHIGGHKDFKHIAVHEKEEEWIRDRFPLPIAMVKQNLLKEECDFPKEFNPNDYKIYQCNPNIILKDGEILDIGGRIIKVIHTPGHSPGHICLYEEDRGYLFSGDLIYKGKLDAFYPTTDPKAFMNSINKVRSLKISRVLPSHYSLDISPGIIEDIYKGFYKILTEGNLNQGAGVFKFKEFSIHI